MNQRFALIASLILLTACPAAAPTITAVSLKPALANLAATASTTVAVEVSGSGEFDPTVNWTLTPNLGTVSTQSNALATYTAPRVSSDTSVVLRATAKGDPSKFGEATIRIIAPTITTVTPAAAKTTLNSEESVSVSATLTGNGVFEQGVAWSIIAGDGSLSSASSNPVTYTAPKVGVDTDVTLQVSAVADPSKKQTISFKVKAAKIIIGLSLSATGNIGSVTPARTTRRRVVIEPGSAPPVCTRKPPPVRGSIRVTGVSNASMPL